MNVVLVPHVNRQEVYAGHDLSSGSAYDDGQGYPTSKHNVSPVNFFMPHIDFGKKKYPLFDNAVRQFVNLGEGDCIFIPAYYYYQY